MTAQQIQIITAPEDIRAYLREIVADVTGSRPPEVYTVAEAADRLKVHPATVRRLIAEGRLPALNVGSKQREYRIGDAAIRRALEEGV